MKGTRDCILLGLYHNSCDTACKTGHAGSAPHRRIEQLSLGGTNWRSNN